MPRGVGSIAVRGARVRLGVWTAREILLPVAVVVASRRGVAGLTGSLAAVLPGIGRARGVRLGSSVRFAIPMNLRARFEEAATFRAKRPISALKRSCIAPGRRGGGRIGGAGRGGGAAGGASAGGACSAASTQA